MSVSRKPTIRPYICISAAQRKIFIGLFHTGGAPSDPLDRVSAFYPGTLVSLSVVGALNPREFPFRPVGVRPCSWTISSLRCWRGIFYILLLTLHEFPFPFPSLASMIPDPDVVFTHLFSDDQLRGMRRFSISRNERLHLKDATPQM